MRSTFFAILTLLVSASFATAQDGYRIQPGDVLAIEVLQDPSLNREILVLPDGSISFPFAGVLPAGGRTIGQVSDALSGGIASNFAAPPNVFVTVRQIQPRAAATGGAAVPRTIEIYFLGEVNNSGPVAIPPGTTLLQALSRAGGFSNFAALHRVQLRRTDPATGHQFVSEIDYRAISRGARLSEDVVLANGDVILVPERRLFE